MKKLGHKNMFKTTQATKQVSLMKTLTIVKFTEYECVITVI